MSKASEKKAAESGGSQIIQMLVTRPAKVESADIGTWTAAINAYKNGNRSKLNDLYENLLSDPVLASALDRRVMAITNAEITFQRDGANVPEIDRLIDTPEFEELISEIALSKAFGKSVIETSFAPEFSVFSIPRKHIKITNLEKPLGERRKFIVAREGNTDGYDYTTDDFFIESGKDTDLGYLFRAAQYVIYKRGGFGDWAQFAEVFGMPFLIGKYNSYDTDSRDKLFEALGQIGSNPRAAIPKETDLDVKENKSSGSNNLYKDLRSACNEEILIAVLSNTMTTVNGSSRAQGEVHQDTQQDVANSDRRFVQRILNKKLIPLLEKRGYPVAGGTFFFPDKSEKLSTSEKLEIALKVKEDGLAVSDDYIYTLTGVPKPEAGQTVSRKNPVPDPNKPDPNKPNPAKPDPVDPDPEPDPIPDPGKTLPAKKKNKAQASLLGKALSFFVKALSRERAPLDF